MERAAIEQLAHHHRPVVFLHPKEPYLPVDFQTYVDSAQLKDTRTQQVVRPGEAFSAHALGQWLQDTPELNSPDYTLFLPLGLDTPVIAQYHPDDAALTQVPLYVSHRTTPPTNEGDFHLLISYSFMYAYNGPESVLCWELGAHYADIEHVTADLAVSRRGDVTFDQLYTSRHNGGQWTPRTELKWQEGERPTVFSSLNGHASYTTPGNTKRYWGVAVDRCDHGPRWDTDRLVFLPTDINTAPPELKWTMFRGSLGDGHVDCYGSKSYLSEDEVNQEYGTNLWPCKWRL